MENKARTVIAQRKRPTIRIGPRLAGLPPDEPAVVVPPPTPAPVKKRGRPKKFGTAAEKQAAYRTRLEAKKQDTERRNLVAEILKIAKRNLSGPGDEITAVRETNIKGANIKYLRTFRDDLLRLPIEKLHESLEALEAVPDSHGRLRNERSGEQERSMGQSEIEKILTGMQHDSSLFETGDEDADRQDPNMARGFQVTPVGAGPDSYEEDADADSADIRSGSEKPWTKPAADEVWTQRTLARLIRQMKINFDTPAKCPFCTETFVSSFGAEHHLADQYCKGITAVEKHRDFVNLVNEMNATMPGNGIRVNSIFEHPAYAHFRLIGAEMDRTRKACSRLSRLREYRNKSVSRR